MAHAIAPSVSLDDADCPSISTELQPILSTISNDHSHDTWHGERPSSSSGPSRLASSRRNSLSCEYDPAHTPESAENFAEQEPANMEVAEQAALRPFSRRPLARAGRDAGFAIVPLYFLVFAILSSKQHDQPKDTALSSDLLALAKYGPTAFGIVFAAVIGRFLTSVAALFLERGASVGVLECCVGARTVFGAASLPIRFRFLHPIMLPLALLWAISPLGGQAALRVISTRMKTETYDATITYLDTFTTPYMSIGGTSSWSGAMITAFNAALASPMTSKRAGQDIYGNIKIPMFESIPATAVPDKDSWYTMVAEDEIIYSSLTGLPMNGGPSRNGKSEFDLRSWYANANCSLAPKTRNTPPDMEDPEPGYQMAWNNMTVGFMYKNDTDTLNDGQAIPFFHYLGVASGTNATCLLTPTYVETRIGCDGSHCKALAQRKSTNLASHPDPFDHSFGASGFIFVEVLNLIIEASMVGYVTGGDFVSTPIEQYFVHPDYPFSAGESVVDLSMGGPLYSQRLTQLINTQWIAALAPTFVLGQKLDQTPTETKPTNQYASKYQLLSSHSTSTEEKEVIQCNTPWLSILCLASIMMFLANSTTIVIDLIRRGPDVLDGLSLAFRDNAFVRGPAGSSMDDGDDIVRRLKGVKVRLGDVQPDTQVGHVAVGTPMSGQQVDRLIEGRSYV